MTTLLLDADIIAFKIASVSQKTFQFDPEDDPIVQADDWEEVVPRIHSAIEAIQESLTEPFKEPPEVVICLSCPTQENWRLKVLPTYKGNRDYSNRPVHLQAVKDYMEANWRSYRRPTLEADDIMGILSTHPTLIPGKKIIVSEDKDMKTVPGWLFNPAKDTKPQLISDGWANYWHLYQSIVGDSTDGYTGCPGAGPEKAVAVLDGGWWHSYPWTVMRGPRKGQQEIRWKFHIDPSVDCWDRIVTLYERFGYTKDDWLVQARVARILRSTDYDFKTKEVKLWTPAS